MHDNGAANPQDYVTELAPGDARIAIVGAGIRGLASAAHLKRLGYRVRVYDKAEAPGGIWQQVYPTSVINTPCYGYTFHVANQWHDLHPSRDGVLRNVDRLVTDEHLADELELGTPVHSVVRSQSGRWCVNDESETFDGLLVCTGFLGEQKRPHPESVADYGGRILLPYAFDPSQLRDRKVVVVGSGSTALEMLVLAHRSRCREATLVVRPGTKVRESDRIADARFWISSNPFLYALTKSGGSGPAAVAPKVSSVLAADHINILEGDFVAAESQWASLADGHRVEADVLIWCTGWNSPTPAWVSANRQCASLVAAMCPRCLDTAGFGFGASTIYAKVLDCILRYGLAAPFDPSVYGCDCEAGPCRHGPNIIVSAMRYLYGQQHGGRMLRRLVAQGFRSNRRRLRETEEPRWVGLLAFANAPFGL